MYEPEYIDLKTARLYLAADSGMRPQEYLAVARSDFKDGGVEVKRAIERPGTRLSVTKTKAGRRFIDLSPEVYEMIMQYINYHTIENRHDLVFPTSTDLERKSRALDASDKREMQSLHKAFELEQNKQVRAGVQHMPSVQPKFTPRGRPAMILRAKQCHTSEVAKDVIRRKHAAQNQPKEVAFWMNERVCLFACEKICSRLKIKSENLIG